MEWSESGAESVSRFRRRRAEGFGQLSHRLLHTFRQRGGAACPTKSDRPTSADALRRSRVHRWRMRVSRFLPILRWLPEYRWRDSFFADLSAGLTMAVFSVPTGIAHAGICGVAPVYGLYTAIFPTFFYLFFGNSKHNALGGFAILTLMTRGAVEKVYRMSQHAVMLRGGGTALNGTARALAAAATATAVLLNSSVTITTTMGPLTPALGDVAADANMSLAVVSLTSTPGGKDDNATTDGTVIDDILTAAVNDSDLSMVFGLSETIDDRPDALKSDPFQSSGSSAALEHQKRRAGNTNPFLHDTFDMVLNGGELLNDGVGGGYGSDQKNLTMLIVGTIPDELAGNETDPTFVAAAAAAAAAVAASEKLNACATSMQTGDASASDSDISASFPSAGGGTSTTTGGGRVVIEVLLSDIRPINVATTILFVSGILQILMGIFRLDFLSCYLSEQVMNGFVVGGCVHVFFSQVGDILGITLPPRSGRGYLYNRLIDLLSRLEETHPPTAIISSCSIGFLLFSQKILEPWLSSVFRFPIPYELILVIVGITATNFAKLSKRHSINVVGVIPTNFPAPALPRFDLISLIFFDALSITLTAVAIHLTVVKIVENRYHYRINSCQELYSLGLAGLCSSFFPVFPVTSIFARTLIGDADENTTHMTIFFSSMGLLAVILYVGPALEYLPKCILASMVVVSLSASFSKFRELRSLWPLFKFDFLIFVVSFLLTVCYDMAEGLTFTVIFAIFTIVVRVQWPKWYFLAHDEACNEFRETPKEQIHEVDGNACVLRYDAPLIFPSVHKFMQVVEQGVKQWERRELHKSDDNTTTADAQWRVTGGSSIERIKHNSINTKSSHKGHGTRTEKTTLIIDCSGFPYVDYLGLCTLKKVYKDFTEIGVTVKFASPKAALMRMFRNTDFMETVPESNIYSTVKHAVDSK